jgi:hypothetical protein
MVIRMVIRMVSRMVIRMVSRMVILWLYGVLEGPQYRVGRGQKLPYVTEIFCFTSFLVGKF